MDSNIHTSELCVIFVDIKDSTIKFINLEREDLQTIISMYMEDVMGTLLKYDITIDKFLGDGVLGFSNDPVPQADYIEKVILAAVEVNEKLELRSEVYKRLWGSKFEVRIGISTGQASVGFYGNDLHVKSYTAIGRVVNLSNRVNGVANPNSVAVSEDVIEKLENSRSNLLKNIIIEDLGSQNLKGFETNKVKIFDLKLKKSINFDTNQSSLNNEPICPNQHGLLFLNQEEDGIYKFKCRFCDYILENDEDKAVQFKKTS